MTAAGRARFAILASLLALASACSHAPQRGEAFEERGMASWYGRAFQGKRTASGERFDMFKFTAAHRELPFGTRVKVQDVKTGRTVTVRVNDRGPFSKDRIIDLSYAAARALGIMQTGMAEVEIHALVEDERLP